MNGIDGNLVASDSNDIWFFELISDVNDSRSILKAGTKLQLLPSSALERMTVNKKERPDAAYRLFNGRVTKYKGKNYIFPNFFLLVSKVNGQQKSDDPNDAASDKKPKQEYAIDDPNDILTMPQEVIEKLRTARSAPSVLPSEKNIESGRQKATLSTNSIFIDRTAFLVEDDKGCLTFVPDALGRNIQEKSFRLLPCEALELTELIQAAEPETLRFKITGIVTEYKGEKYLLLEKATRAYSHGNFGR